MVNVRGMRLVILHQSDLQSWARCPHAWQQSRDGVAEKVLSATSYGVVMHHAMHILERTGDLDAAIDTFTHYWHPLRIETLAPQVEVWIRGETYAGLLRKGVDTLRKYDHLIKFDDHELLALEYEFIVPVHGTVDRVTGEPHLLAGTIDRLAARHYKRVLTLCIDDFKTGKRSTYLRHNPQGTGYSYASTLPEFWVGNPAHLTEGFGAERGTQLMERFASAARRFWWIDLKDCKFVNGGWRGEQDYRRFALAIQNMGDSIQAEIFPLTMQGDVCQWCSFRETCGGIGLDDDSGNPT